MWQVFLLEIWKYKIKLLSLQTEYTSDGAIIILIDIVRRYSSSIPKNLANSNKYTNIELNETNAYAGKTAWGGKSCIHSIFRFARTNIGIVDIETAAITLSIIIV